MTALYLSEKEQDAMTDREKVLILYIIGIVVSLSLVIVAYLV